jgi:hypothetical protein
MFENSSVMIITADNNRDNIFRLELNAATQKEICKSFSNAHDTLLFDKDRVIFNGSYKPNNDEFLAINNFQLPSEIMDAIRDPIGVASYMKENDEFPKIKAIFVGERIQTNESEKFNIAFQRFRKEQYISPKWCNLFFDQNTFIQEKRFGISISDSVDCFYTNGELQFVSFFFARQVFDLSDYYHSATDQEVGLFVTNEKLSLENTDDFNSIASTTIRRKIAMINDSKVLENFTTSQIKSLASSSGIEIKIENNRIVVPNDKAEIKILFGFLCEEAYKGPFSENTYLANSKRQI